MRRGGFSLLDLLVALALISVFASVAIPVYFSRPEVTLENAAVLLAKDLRAAQNRAAYSGEETYFVVDPEGDGYRVLDAHGGVVENPRSELPFERSYSFDAVFRGVRISDVRFGPDQRLTFGPQGKPLESVQLTLTYRDDRRILKVDPPYGYITIVGSSSGWIDVGY